MDGFGAAKLLMATKELAELDVSCDGWLLDTNIISQLIGRKPVPDKIASFFAEVPDERLRLSVITVGELRKGVELLPRDERASARFRSELELKVGQLHKRWSERILPIDFSVADRWGLFLAEYQRTGKPLPAVDALIAATASIHNLVVVSHDSIFKRIGQIEHYDPYSLAPP